jgi:hypothetical protein
VSDVLHSPLGMTLGCLAGSVATWLVLAWWLHRDRRRWRREAELRQQLWEVEDQLWRDSLPDWQREAMARGRQQRVAIQREARRRLGLPEEASDYPE